MDAASQRKEYIGREEDQEQCLADERTEEVHLIWWWGKGLKDVVCSEFGATRGNTWQLCCTQAVLQRTGPVSISLLLLLDVDSKRAVLT